MIGGLVAGIVLSLITLRSMEPEYTAQMVVGPTARVGLAAMGPRAGQGLAAFRPIVEPGPGDELLSDFSRYMQMMRSVTTAERLLAQPDLMQRLLEDQWDSAAGGWRPPSGVLPVLRRTILRLAGRTPWVPPDAVLVSDLLRREVAVHSLGKQPIYRVVFRHRDRALAIDTIARIHAATEATIRAEAEERTRRQIDHITRLQPDLRKDSVKAALSVLQADLEQLRMMIDVGLPLAADLIEPPSAPPLPDWPDPILVLLTGILTGPMVVLFVVCMRLGLREAEE